jgi:hypothetical protein
MLEATNARHLQSVGLELAGQRITLQNPTEASGEP